GAHRQRMRHHRRSCHMSDTQPLLGSLIGHAKYGWDVVKDMDRGRSADLASAVRPDIAELLQSASGIPLDGHTGVLEICQSLLRQISVVRHLGKPHAAALGSDKDVFHGYG